MLLFFCIPVVGVLVLALVSQVYRRKENIWLALLMLIMTCGVFICVQRPTEWLTPYHSTVILNFLAYSALPLLYFYVSSVTATGQREERMRWALLIPAILMLASLHWFWRHEEYAEIMQLSLHVRAFLFTPLVLFLTGWRLVKNLDLAKKDLSSIPEHYLNWQWFVLCGFVSVWVVVIIARILGGQESVDMAFSVSFLIFAVVLNVVALRKSPYLEVCAIEEKSLLEKPAPLSKEEIETKAKKIEDVFKTQKPYRNEHFRISDLAQLIGEPVYITSLVLNRAFQLSFFDLVAKWRAAELKSLLEDPATATEGILQLGYKVGFNSKSNLNKAFKTLTQMSPSEFRKTRNRPPQNPHSWNN